MAPYQPWIEISGDNLVHNLNQIRTKIAPDQPLFAVVKADAYGCGAAVISQWLAQEKVTFLVVVRMYEAVQIRKILPEIPILVMGECSRDELIYASSHRISIALNDCSSVAKMAACGCDCTIHCNIDTGMHRMGILPRELPALLSLLRQHPRLVVEGAYTHFACADAPETATVMQQYALFSDACNNLTAAGYTPRYIHTANSAATLRFPTIPHHGIRLGIALYGCKPDPTQEFPVDLQPVLSLKAPIVKIKEVAAATPISYGATYRTPARTRIATIPLGYSHGFPRSLSNNGEVLICGRRYPIVGRVTMDYVMVDIGMKDTLTLDDEVVVIGTQGTQRITPDDIAVACNTIGYEIQCNLHRMQRRFFRHGNLVAQTEVCFD
ncbi:MAG: alanine racemase [Chitinivibrionales bacterium]|nr:alanine racemase [Chitinivibrionales bacterium]